MMHRGVGYILGYILPFQVSLSLRLVNPQREPWLVAELGVFFEPGTDKFLDGGRFVVGEAGDLVPKYHLLECDEGHLARGGEHMAIFLEDGRVGSEEFPFFVEFLVLRGARLAEKTRVRLGKC